MSRVSVGVVGYVIDGGGKGAGKYAGLGYTVRRCQNCGESYPKHFPACPECDADTPRGENEALVVGQLNRHLYEQAGLRTKSGDFRI